MTNYSTVMDGSIYRRSVPNDHVPAATSSNYHQVQSTTTRIENDRSISHPVVGQHNLVKLQQAIPERSEGIVAAVEKGFSDYAYHCSKPLLKQYLVDDCLIRLSLLKANMNSGRISIEQMREEALSIISEFNRVIIREFESEASYSSCFIGYDALDDPELAWMLQSILFDAIPESSIRYSGMNSCSRSDKKYGVLEFDLGVARIQLTNRVSEQNSEYGQGSFGRVRAAIGYSGLARNNPSYPLAVKKLPLWGSVITTLNAYKEIQANKKLANNENVLACKYALLYNSHKDKPKYGPNGSRHPQVAMIMDVIAQVSQETFDGFPFERKCKLFEDIASGLVQMHQSGVVHNDFKLNNCGMMNGKMVVLDFGISLLDGKTFLENLVQVIQIGGSHPSPECYRLRDASLEDLCQIDRRKIDVWAFGVMLCETLHSLLEGPHNSIYQQLSERIPVRIQGSLKASNDWLQGSYYCRDNSDLLKNYCDQLKLTLENSSGNHALDELILDCLAYDPMDRPTMDEVRGRIAQLKI